MLELEIFTTGGGYYLQDTFNYLAAYTGSANFETLLYIGLILGVFMGAWRLMLGEAVSDTLKYMLFAALIMTATLGPKARVIIIDETAGTIPIYGTVDNVPYAVALVGHYTSSLSHYITNHMETLLSSPTDLEYQRNGMLFGATLLSQAANWNAVTPKIHENVLSFMQGCVIDAANLGHTDLELVATSGDLETFVGANLPASLAYYDVVTNTTETCVDGWPNVQASVTAEVDKVLAQKAASMFHGRAATGIENINRLKGSLGDFQTMMQMSSATAVHTIQQAMYVNALDDGVQRFIATSGNAAAMQQYQSARADIQTRASYSAIGNNALRWVPLLKIVFETLYYSAFPLAVFLMMTPMVATVAKGYFGGFVWIAAWEPLSAILHTVMTKASAGYYREAGVTTTDGSVSDVVLSWANHFGIRAVEQDVGSIAGYLMMSVPFLATAIMFGANRMVGMATSMLNVSQGAAIETGREAATGSMSLGNLSMNNMMSNKTNTSSVRDTGRDTFVTDRGGMITRNTDGSAGYAGGSAVSSGGVGAQLSQQVRSEVSARAESSRTAARSAASDFSSYVDNTGAELTNFARSVSQGQQRNEGQGWEVSEANSQAVSNSWSNVEQFAKTNAISTDLAMQVGVSASASAGYGNTRLGASVGANALANVSGVSQERAQELLQSAHNSGLSNDVSHIMTNRQNAGVSSTDGTQTSASEQKNYSVADGQRLAQSYLARLDEAETYANAESYVKSGGAGVDINLNQMAAAELSEQGMSPTSISNVLNPISPEEVASSRAVVSGIVDDLADGVIQNAPPSDGTQGFTPDSGQISSGPLPSRSATFGNGGGGTETVSLDERRAAAIARFAEDQSDITAEGRGMYGAFDGKRSDQQGEVVARQTSLAANADKTVGRAMAERIAGMFGASESEMTALQQAHPEAWTSPGAALDYYAANPDLYQEVTGRPFVSGGDPVGSSPQPDTTANPLPAKAYSAEDRDVMTRTLLGEAANQGDVGMAAVALVMRNRIDDPRFPATGTDVGRDPGDFSAWNKDGSGNELVAKYSPKDPEYQRAAYLVDAVMGGFVPDFTKGATHYYSPAGMKALVDQGYQSNEIPTWLRDETHARDAPPVAIGGHVFTGQKKG